MRLILAHPMDPDERDRILKGLELELSNVQEEPGQAYFEVWLPVDLEDETVLHYVDDLPIGVRYFVVKGDSSWVGRIRQSFSILTDDEVLERARRARDDHERIEATYMLALIAGPRVEDRIQAELEASLNHASEDVRFAAVLAVGYTTWPALRDRLGDVATKDASARVRERATSMRKHLIDEHRAEVR